MNWWTDRKIDSGKTDRMIDEQRDGKTDEQKGLYRVRKAFCNDSYFRAQADEKMDSFIC